VETILATTLFVCNARRLIYDNKKTDMKCDDICGEPVVVL